MLGGRALILGAALAVALGAAAARAQPVDTVVGHKSAAGKHAQAIAFGKTVRVSKFAVHVTAKPNQRVTGYWGYHCTLGVTIGDRDADDFARKTPFTVPMRTPRMGNTSYSCDLVGGAKLTRRGRVTVELIARS
jgi:hypothetical protein